MNNSVDPCVQTSVLTDSDRIESEATRIDFDLSADFPPGTPLASAIVLGRTKKPSRRVTNTLLDTSAIRESCAPNRDDSTYTGAAFDQLRESIRQHNGNLEAIKVRCIKPDLSGQPNGFKYEVVFGHRRLRACRELGLQVEAMVVADMDDRQAMLERVAENSGRADFTVVDLGRICIDALARKLFSTQKLLAAALGRDPSDVSKSIAIASLPAEVIDAFDNPGDLQFRHAKPLREAVARDSEAVLAAAKALADEIGPKPPSAVLARLIGGVPPTVGPSNSQAAIQLNWKGTNFGELVISASGQVTIKIADQLDVDIGNALVIELQEFYGLHLSDRTGSLHQRRLERAS